MPLEQHDSLDVKCLGLGPHLCDEMQHQLLQSPQSQSSGRESKLNGHAFVLSLGALLSVLLLTWSVPVAAILARHNTLDEFSKSHVAWQADGEYKIMYLPLDCALHLHLH